MKFKCLLIILLTSLGLSAQNSSFGIRIGLNAANLSSSNTSNNTNYGFIGGLTYRVDFTKRSFLNVDVLYAEKGFVFSEPVFDATIILNCSPRFNYNFLSFPIKYGYKLGQKDLFFAKVGVVPSFILSAKLVQEVFLRNDPGNEYGQYIEDLKSFDMAILVEIGVNLKQNDKRVIYMSLGANRSYVNALEYDEGNNHSNRIIGPKHIAFDCSVGYLFERNN